MNIPKGYLVSGSNIEEVLRKYGEKATEIISEAMGRGEFLKVAGQVAILKSSEYPFNLVFFIGEDEMATLKLQMETLAEKSNETLDNIKNDMNGSCPVGGTHRIGENGTCTKCGAEM